MLIFSFYMNLIFLLSKWYIKIEVFDEIKKESNTHSTYLVVTSEFISASRDHKNLIILIILFFITLDY